MYKIVVWCSIVTIITAIVHIPYNIEENVENMFSNRSPKFWTSGLVRIENSVCLGVDRLMGTCYTRWQCKSINGILGGRCHGVGTCCVVQQSCGTISSYNNTYFVNPDYPTAYTRTGLCSIVIQKCHASICQVRLDFNVLRLSQPNGTGYCENDALYITGGASVFTPICGENSGQHVYMNFNGNNDIRLTINISPDLDFARDWQIRISQIDCGCPTTAPSGCLMYYTDLSGTVSSFNFDTTQPSSTYTVGEEVFIGTRQIANTNYGICVAMQPGYCGIKWSRSSPTQFSFHVSGPSNIIGCTTDYVIIPNPEGLTVDRFCGANFTDVITYSKPFVLTVVTNGDEINDRANRGFSLDYMQILCGSNMIP